MRHLCTASQTPSVHAASEGATIQPISKRIGCSLITSAIWARRQNDTSLASRKNWLAHLRPNTTRRDRNFLAYALLGLLFTAG